MILYPRSLAAFLRELIWPAPVSITRAIRVCRVEEAANVRSFYHLDADDLALWDVEWHEWAAAEQRRRRSDAP